MVAHTLHVALLDRRLRMNYGEAFAKMGIKGMGRLGASWCALNPEGVMVLMAHQNYFRPTATGSWEYLDPGAPNEINHSSSAKISMNLLAEYFEPGRQILLIIGKFYTDGDTDDSGVTQAAKFESAAGGYYVAEMVDLDRANGMIRCHCIRREQMR